MMEGHRHTQLLPPLHLRSPLKSLQSSSRLLRATSQTMLSSQLRVKTARRINKARSAVTPVKTRCDPGKSNHKRFFSTMDVKSKAPAIRCQWDLQDIAMRKCIGKGSLGKVMLGEVQGFQVAVKVVGKVPAKVRKTAEAERKVLEELKHQLIVTYYGSLEDQEYIYLVLEYLPKGDLFHLMKRRRLKTKEIRFFAMEVAVALKSLHDDNIVYRDLKPENVMLHESGHIRLIDFGFAKKLSSERTASVLGSPEYMAPEVVMRKPHGLAVDCWSFGILLFELWTQYFPDSHPPFQGTSPMEVYEHVLQGLYELPSFIDTQAKDLIRRLLNPEPRLRPSITGVRAHAYFGDVDWLLADSVLVVPPALGESGAIHREHFRTDLFDG